MLAISNVSSTPSGVVRSRTKAYFNNKSIYRTAPAQLKGVLSGAGHIAIDMDEVIVNMFVPLIHHYENVYSKSFDLKNVKTDEYNYAKLFDISPREAQWLVYSYWNSDIHKDQPAIEGALESFKALKMNDVKITIVTARQHYAKKQTILWLKNNGFDEYYDNIVFTNSYSLVGNEENKEDICRLIDASLLIDDSYNTIKKCNDIGMDTLWFTGYPRYFWCNVCNTDELYEVASWKYLE